VKTDILCIIEQYKALDAVIHQQKVTEAFIQKKTSTSFVHLWKSDTPRS
jgi:hypothetical protein